MKETVDFVRNTGITIKKNIVNNERDKTVNKIFVIRSNEKYEIFYKCSFAVTYYSTT
jgi:hypothetical protein